ncbi:MAG TPA: ROK family protein [Acidobacteriaceae bacterium]|nr:ROK family protein [Acidobacteriaceae bacterium]
MMPTDEVESGETSPELPEQNSRDCVAAVDIGGTSLRIALADMTGDVVAEQSASTVGVRDAAAVIEMIRNGVVGLIEQSGRSHDNLLAVAAGAPGITDADAGVVIATSYLMGWRQVPFQDLLESALEVPSAVENDVNLGAIGEQWRGAARNVRDFVFLAIGTGVGAGIVLDGKLFRGTGWSAGEIGYMLVPGTSTDPVADGDAGNLESLIGGEGIRAQWQKLWDAGGLALPRDLRATDVFDQARAGSPPAQAVLQRSARLLAFAIYNMWLMFNCPLFVLGGSVGMHPALLESAQLSLRELCGEAGPDLALSTLGTQAQLNGAIRLALDRANAVRKNGTQFSSKNRGA